MTKDKDTKRDHPKQGTQHQPPDMSWSEITFRGVTLQRKRLVDPSEQKQPRRDAHKR